MGKLTRLAVSLAFAVLAAPFVLCVCLLALMIPFCLGVPLHAPVYVGIPRGDDFLKPNPAAPAELAYEWYGAARYQPAISDA